MIRRPYNPAANRMRAPATSFGQTLARAARLAGVWSVLLVLLCVAALLLAHLFQEQRFVGDAPKERLVLDVAALLAQAGQLGLFLFATLFVALAVFLQRAWQDRVFSGVGLVATFFGLGMLLYFFTQLALDVRLYFAVTPALIEAENRALDERLQHAEQLIQEAQAADRQEMAEALAATADAKKQQEIRDFYEKEVFPNREKDLRQKAEEDEIDARVGRRANTSTLALLWHFLTHGPSKDPQDVGIFTALLGSLWIAGITVLFAVPVGVGAALYLEEYRSNRWLDTVIQVNINNLAGIPSVVYGILGGFVFVEMIFKPLTHWYPTLAARNVLGGGLTLGLLTLPVVIVSAQEAIRAVPASLREAAYALGATRWQVTRYQVLPLALPGILTGTILALSRAIGEAAPLVLFGALQFVDQNPSWQSRFTVLPLQIFGWSDRPRVEVPGHAATVDVWRANAALASVLLLAVLLSLNGLAIYLRYRAQRQPRS
jgi:phosphate transport system permease protein